MRRIGSVCFLGLLAVSAGCGGDDEGGGSGGASSGGSTATGGTSGSAGSSGGQGGATGGASGSGGVAGSSGSAGSGGQGGTSGSQGFCPGASSGTEKVLPFSDALSKLGASFKVRANTPACSTPVGPKPAYPFSDGKEYTVTVDASGKSLTIATDSGTMKWTFDGKGRDGACEGVGSAPAFYVKLHDEPDPGKGDGEVWVTTDKSFKVTTTAISLHNDPGFSKCSFIGPGNILW